MSSADLAFWLIERTPCRRCRTTLHDMATHTPAGIWAGPSAAVNAIRSEFTVLACTAAGHPGAWQDRTPSRLDDPPDKDRVQELVDVTPMDRPPGTEFIPGADAGPPGG